MYDDCQKAREGSKVIIFKERWPYGYPLAVEKITAANLRKKAISVKTHTLNQKELEIDTTIGGYLSTSSNIQYILSSFPTEGRDARGYLL